MQKELSTRSNGSCELCSVTEELNVFVVSPKAGKNIDECIHICNVCNDQLTEATEMEPNHWRCINDSMWSDVEAVKVVAYRVLNILKSEGWPNDLIESFHMEEETQKWTKYGITSEDTLIHIDSNGVQLLSGDSVILTKDLKVKGGGDFTAKRGTTVRNMSLVFDNIEHIEGRVEGVKIVILTKYVKK